MNFLFLYKINKKSLEWNDIFRLVSLETFAIKQHGVVVNCTAVKSGRAVWKSVLPLEKVTISLGLG